MKEENETVNNVDSVSQFQYLNEQYNPEGSDLRKYQLHLLEAMKMFDKWCKKHDIKYSLAYGTMLGAVRHKGFIPWDDDADFLMDRDNYNKLCQYMSEHYSELSDNLFIVNGIRPELFYDPFCYIDIFVVDDSPNNHLLRFIKDLAIKILYALIKIKTKSKSKKNILLSFSKLLCSPISLKKIKYYYSNVVPLWFVSDKCRNYEKVQVYNDIISCVHKKFTAQDFVSYDSVEFEGYMFPVFSNFDSILRASYGDYMRIPSNKESHGYYKDFFYKV